MGKINLKVAVFKGKEASVNSYLFENGQSMIVMDVLRNSKEALELVEVMKKKKLPLTHILITHGHPDHYIGMNEVSKAFPKAKIVTPSAEIKADIIGFSQYMESIGWLDGEPSLKPRTTENPDGFDYEGAIDVLESNTLELRGGGVLEIDTQYLSAEAEHLSTVFSKDLNALFTSDFCYNGVHLWLGPGVSEAHIINWKKELHRLKENYGGSNITIYPGHGDKAGSELFDTVLDYLTDFEQAIDSSTTKEQAMKVMKDQYPDWKQDDFLLVYSVNHHMDLKNSDR